MDTEKIVVERDRPGRPYEGRVFIAVQAHLDDIPHHAAGLCAKLVHEGYTGYIVRTSNDEKRGGKSAARNILSNEQEHIRMAHALGCKDVFEFYYQNHEMNGISSLDIRGRLIFLIRSEEHTSELQSHSFISYAVFCLKKKIKTTQSGVFRRAPTGDLRSHASPRTADAARPSSTRIDKLRDAVEDQCTCFFF